MMEKKGFWFALKSNVYVEFKEKRILLYDTKFGENIETEQEENIALIVRLYEPENLGVILIQDELQTDVGVFIHEIIDKKMGDLINIKENLPKPVRLVPILNLQKDIDKHRQHEDKRIFLGKNISKYLLEINIYLNATCENTCKECMNYNKQIHCCTTNNAKEELSVENLQVIFEQLHYFPIKKINILGGNILKYVHLEELCRLSALYPKVLHLYMHYENYQKHKLIDSQQLELIVTFPIKRKKFQEIWQVVERENTQLHLIVEDEEQYYMAENLLGSFNIEKYEIHPFFNGRNLSFFEKSIFLNKEDIFSKVISMREIFRNQKLNSNFFGTLYILPDGSVKANINTSILGNIGTDKILDIIYQELTVNTAWRVVRNSQPCSECIYQFFCPAPSDYERAIGQNNLCQLKQVE